MGRSAKRLYSGWVCKKCAVAFANRRQGAYLLDSIAFMFATMAVTYVIDREAPIVGAALTASSFAIIDVIFQIVVNFLFICKDGFTGKSLGRWLTGVTVVDETTREPIGFAQSFKRNLCLIVPLAFLVILVQMMKGKRWGDGWARTRVIWDMYRHAFPFEDRGFVCQGCGYDLTGNTSGICPECGRRIPQHMQPPPVAQPVSEGAA